MFESITNLFSQYLTWTDTLGMWNVLLALIVIAAGVFIAIALKPLVEFLLNITGLSKLLDRGRKKSFDWNLLAVFAVQWLFMVFIIETAMLFTQVSWFERAGRFLIQLIPNVLTAIVIMLFAVVLANYLSNVLDKLNLENSASIAGFFSILIYLVAGLNVLALVPSVNSFMPNLFYIFAGAVALGMVFGKSSLRDLKSLFG